LGPCAYFAVGSAALSKKENKDKDIFLLHNEIHSMQDLYSLHLSKKGTVEINTQLRNKRY
jgi:hypothetical protein